MLNTLKTAEHGSQAQRLLGAAGGELLQVSEHSERPALAFDLVAEVHPYLFSLFIRRQNGRGDLAGFWVDILRAGGDLFKPRPVRFQTRVCVGVALQRLNGDQAVAGQTIRRGEQEARKKALPDQQRIVQCLLHDHRLHHQANAQAAVVGHAGAFQVAARAGALELP
ncbi:hypothetical protein D3C80_1436420 [compost metagenome]